MRGKLVLSSIVLVVVMAFLRGCAFRPQTNNPGNSFNQGDNAIWLSVDWVNQSHPSDEITALANNLAAQQIRYVFVYVSYMQPATHDFNQTFTYAANFVKNFHLAQPRTKILAWIGVPLSDGITFNDSDVRSRIVAFSKQMIGSEGFDGVHLDAEPISSGDQDFLSLLADVRQAISPAMLSIAAEKIQPIFPNLALPGGRFIGWSADYYRQIAQKVDQIAVMSYDTAMPFGWLYREFMRFEVVGITHALSGVQTNLLFGISVSEELTATHNPAAENVTDGIQGVVDGLNDADTVPGLVSGLAVYPGWEMNDQKWSIYDPQWLGASFP